MTHPALNYDEETRAFIVQNLADEIEMYEGFCKESKYAKYTKFMTRVFRGFVLLMIFAFLFLGVIYIEQGRWKMALLEGVLTLVNINTFRSLRATQRRERERRERWTEKAELKREELSILAPTHVLVPHVIEEQP